MSYATPLQLIGWFGGTELGETAAPDDARAISPALMRLTIDGGNRSAWSAEEIAAADQALINIQTALADASKRMDGYISARYTLPLAEEVVTGSDLPRICGDIARLLLMRSNPREEAIRRETAALGWLRDVSKGIVKLGNDVVAPVNGAGSPMTRQGVRLFPQQPMWPA